MKKNWLIVVIVIVVAVAAGLLHDRGRERTASVETPEAADTGTEEAGDVEEAESVPLSHESAELTAYGFILDFLDVGEDGANAEVVDDIMTSLSRQARSEVARETILTDLKTFMGVEGVPENGASVEDLRVVSAEDVFLVVGLNYTGGRELRSVHLVVENGEWRVDRVSVPEDWP